MTKQLGKIAYQLNIDNMDKDIFLDKWKKFDGASGGNKYFVYSKVNTDKIGIFSFLGSEGYKLIDTNIKLALHGRIVKKRIFPENVEFIFAEKNHQNLVGLIAHNNFTYSRFHLDPQISNSTANQLKQNWAENYFLGKRGDELILALIDGIPVGFLQLIIKNNDLLIDLICVNKKTQSQGIASGMIQFADHQIQHSCIKVGTQIGNIPSIKLYLKLGFIITGSDYVFHYHSL